MTVNNQSIIIKRVKKVAGGHHGGAWKVAYADFVTAMMAFFLLLWLLNATEAENLAGLADYFAPTVGVKDEMGIGFRGGKSALSEGIGADKNTNKGIVFGGIPTGPITKVTEKLEERTDQDKQEQIQVVINDVATDKKGSEENQDNPSSPAVPITPETPASSASTPVAAPPTPPEMSEELQKTEQAVQTTIQDMIKNRRIDEGAVEIKRTPEGLMIEIKDLSGNSMFDNDTAVMKDKLKNALVDLTKILKNIPNNLAIIGHTNSAPIKTKISGYTKWELSADRANATRNFLNNNGVDAEQFSRIEGRADNVPYDRRKPEASINDRINIIILDKNDTPNHKKSTPDSILIDMKSEKTKEFIEDIKKSKEKTKDKKAEEIKPVKDNADIKQMLRDSANTGNEAAKNPTETKENLLNGDVIDLSPDKNKPENIPAPTQQNNNDFQNILNESEKAATTTAPSNQRSADVIDLTQDKKEAVITKPVAQPSANQEFLNILGESKKIEGAKAVPVPAAILKNNAPDVIDLSVDKKKDAEETKPLTSPAANQEFLNILKETEDLKNKNSGN